MRKFRLLALIAVLVVTVAAPVFAFGPFYVDVVVLRITDRTPIPQYDLVQIVQGPFATHDDAVADMLKVGQQGAFDGDFYYPPHLVQAAIILPTFP